MKRFLPSLTIFVFMFCVLAAPTWAAEVLGVHILNTGELPQAESLMKTDQKKDQWNYVTIPLTLNDLDKKEDWQRFFYEARAKKFQPIIRLAGRPDGANWTVPTRKDIVNLTTFMSSMDWPQDAERIVVVLNEPNHAQEWGGSLNPEQYASLLQFTGDWLHSEDRGYVVLPAGLDLAAPNGRETMEAFAYLDRMIKAEPDLLTTLDGWTSHSYPNPGFSASPQAQGKNSLIGYRYELDFLKKYTDKQFPVYITETGWVQTPQTSKWLTEYYQYAVNNIWSDPHIRAVTPFVLQGAPGSFAKFSFLDAAGKPTKHYEAYRKVLERM